MVYLNYRCIQLINYLILNDDSINIRELSKVFSVSKRTIQYDLDKIDEWLKDNRLPILCKERAEGVRLVRDERIYQKAAELYEKADFTRYVCSPDERMQVIMQELLFNTNEKITLLKLSEKLCVSKITIFNDITAIKDYLLDYNIIVTNNSIKGYYLKGEEKSIREVYFNLFVNLYNHFEKIEMIDNNVTPNISLLGKWRNNKSLLMNNLDMDYLIDCLFLQLKSFNILLTDKSFYHLCIKIAIKIVRIRNGFFLNPTNYNNYNINEIAENNEFKLAKSLVEQLGSKFNIEFPYEEMVQLAMDILGTKIQIFNMEKDLNLFIKNGVVTEEALIISDEISNKVGNKLGLKIDKDKDLIIDLAIHITSLLHRLRFNLNQEKNFIIDDFKENFPEVYNISKTTVIEILKKYANKSLDEDEIGFIAMHLGAAIYRGMNNRISVKEAKVIIVCGTGLGTAKLIATQIENEFDSIEIVDIIPYYLIKEIISESSYDFIISTVPLDALGIEYIFINPILNDEDITRLSKFFRRNSEKTNYSNMLKLVISEVSRFINLDYMQRVQIEMNVLKQILNKGKKEHKKVNLPRLSSLFNKETIILNLSVRDWKEAIECVGLPLLKLGYINKEYIDSAIKQKERLGIQMIIGDGIAFPHAFPEDGVNKLGFSLATLSNPVSFDRDKGEKIDLIIMMATTNSWIHVEALSDLVILLKDEESLRKIRQARDPMEVINIINNLGKQR